MDGVKHDLVPLIDLDGDGDLDVLTTEETKGLGVVWYENPTRTAQRATHSVPAVTQKIDGPITF